MTRTEAHLRVQDGLRRAEGRLAKTHGPLAGWEAVTLLSAIRGCSRAEVWTQRHDRFTRKEAEAFERVVTRRCAGEPGPYAAGRAAFRHLELMVDARVLIPRPETEGLVDLVLEWAHAQDHRGALRGLEIGVGSGCVILSLASEGPFSSLVGTETSREALAVAAANLAMVRPSAAVRLVRGSFSAAVADGSFDCIASNPPYLSPDEYEVLEPGVRRYEPEDALVSPDGGLFHTRGVCEAAARGLKPGGLFVMEIDARRAPESVQLVREAGLRSPTVRQDLFGRSRYVTACAPER